MKSPKRIVAMFYGSASGAEPVREQLKELPQDDRHIVGFDIAPLEFGWPIGVPLCRGLGRGLWEVCSTLTRGRIARVIFCIGHGHMILLHAFIKKTEKTPQIDMDLAYRRQAEIGP